MFLLGGKFWKKCRKLPKWEVPIVVPLSNSLTKNKHGLLLTRKINHGLRWPKHVLLSTNAFGYTHQACEIHWIFHEEIGPLFKLWRTFFLMICLNSVLIHSSLKNDEIRRSITFHSFEQRNSWNEIFVAMMWRLWRNFTLIRLLFSVNLFEETTNSYLE